jgi:S1-C subfamily serine protease
MKFSEKPIYVIIGAIVVCSALVGGLAGYFTAQALVSGKPFLNNVNNLISDQKVMNQNASDGIVKVVEQSSPAVVSIIVSKDLPKVIQSPNDLFRQFFGGTLTPSTNGETEKQTIGGGSGFIVSKDGYIVTNKHVVIDEAAEYTVLLNSGDKFVAKVLARDPTNDLAVLKIDAKKDLPTLEFGNSDTLKAGQSVVAIGNALGEFRNTVSTGVVSGLARSITASTGGLGSERLVGLIQTDASINPGNSGGPLLDTAGRVIGINVAIASGAQNIGFALPINQVKETIDSIKKNGRLIRAWLGVRYAPITAEVAKANNLKYDYGALVVKGDQPTDLAVVPGSPADKAGLEENDIILEADGKKITESEPLSLTIARHKPGDLLKLRIFHKDREKDTTVVLEEMKQ